MQIETEAIETCHFDWTTDSFFVLQVLVLSSPPKCPPSLHPRMTQHPHRITTGNTSQSWHNVSSYTSQKAWLGGGSTNQGLMKRFPAAFIYRMPHGEEEGIKWDIERGLLEGL